MKALICLLITAGFVHQAVMARQELNHWYFGYNGGLQFTNGTPVYTPGSFRSREGGASISDRQGNLLFYTDGITVWNRNHLPMANGTGLAGDTGSTQSAFITYYPGNDSLYYIFTTAAEGGPDGLQYSLVNMNSDGGLGDVIQKNTALLTPACEKIAAVKHRNANDLWLIAHGFGTDEFYVYAITCNGLNTTPSIIKTGPVIDRVSNTIGYMKVSPDGKKLAMANFTSMVVLFDFDDLTGNISNPQAIATNPNGICGPYGVAFSPDSKLLYTSEIYNCNGTGNYFIFQYRTDAADVLATQFIVNGGIAGTSGAAGALQSGPDNRIYIAWDFENFIGVIANPNVYGPGCNFIKQYITLPPGIISGGSLPSFVTGYHRTLLGNDDTLCDGIPKILKIDLPNATFLWQDGSTLDSFVVTASGDYWVQLTWNGCVYRDTISVHYKPKPVADLGKDTALCNDRFPFLLGQTVPGAAYLWQDSSVNNTYAAGGPGLYWLEISLNGCTGRDSLILTALPVTPFSLGADTAVCATDSISLGVTGVYSTYLWNTGSTAPGIIVRNYGDYWCEAVNSDGCRFRDSISILLQPAPVFSLGRDTSLCTGATLLLDISNAGDQYLWQDSSVLPQFLVTAPGTYHVQVSRESCRKADTIVVQFKSKPQPALGMDRAICPGQELVLDPHTNGVSYVWQDGVTTAFYTVTVPGRYLVTVYNECGSGSDEIIVQEGLCKPALPNAFTPDKSQNNVFRLLNWYGVTGFTFQVYNRWGQPVYRSSDPAEGWNGSSNGKHQPAGTYAYLLSYTDPSGKKIILKGVVLLIR